jgi:hypothetical protein
MTTEPDQVTKVRYNLMQYGRSKYLRSNFFGKVTQKEWNAQVEPKITKFLADPDFCGYMPKEKLNPGIESKLSDLTSLIIRLEDAKN